MTRRRGALPRFLARGAAVVALFVVFAVSLVAGALLHMNLSLGRRMAAHVANHALAGLSSGPVKLTEIERLTLGRIEVRRVEADIAGAGHGRAEFVRARVDWWRTLRATLHERGVTSIHVTDVEAALVDFELRVESKPAPAPAGPEAPSRELRLEVGRLAVAHAYLNGALPSGQVVDLDLDRLRANLSLDGTRVRAGVSTGATVRAILPKPIELEIEANASLALGTSSGAPRSGSVDLHGQAGELRFDARGALLADGVDIEVVVPEAAPDAIRSLWEAAPFTQPASARVRAGGTWPWLDARLEVTAGTGVLHSEGRVNLEGRARVDATLSARDVDLRALFEGAPRSNIAFDGRIELSEVEARRGGIPLEGALSFSTLGGSMAGEPLPRVDGRLTIDPAASLRVTASVDEPGALLRVEAIRTRNGTIHASVEGSVPSLANAPRLARFGLSGTGRAVLRGEGSLTGDVVSSEVTADVYRMGFGKFAVGAGRLQLSIQGALAAPRLAGFAHLIAVRREPFAVNDLLIRAEGSTDSFDVEVAGRGGTLDVVALQSAVRLAGGVEVRGLSARLERETQTVVLGADRLALSRGAFHIEGLSIEGLGAPVRIDAHRASGVVKADVSAPEFNLARLSALVGASTEHFAGRGSMNLSLEIDQHRSFAEGHAVLEDGVFGNLPRLDAVLDVGIDGAAVQALFSARNPELGGIHLEAGGTLGGSLLDPRSFVGSTGRVALSTDRISLRLVCGAIPCPSLLRQAGANMGLTLQGKIEAERDPTSPDGDTRLHLRIEANDTRGPLAFVEVSSQVDLARALVDRRLPNDAPLEASFGIEPRSLDGLPADLRPTGLSGAVQVHGYAQGTIGQPFLALEVAGSGIRYGAQRPDAPALDVKWVTTYDLEQAASEIQVYAGSHRVIDATAQVDASLEKLLAGGDRGWNGGVYAELDRFPLSFVPHEADQRMTGAVTGKVSASGLHTSPRIDVHLAVDELRVGRVSAGPVVLGVLASETDCTAALDTGAATGGVAGAGSASVRATAGCAWKDATWPSLDPSVPIRVWLDAAQFPIGSAAPLVDGAIERLGGTLDAHLRATGATEGDGRRWRIAGAAHVRDGNLLPLPIGREFKHLQIDFGAAEDGTVRVERLSGEVGAGRFDATGTLMLRDLGIEKGQADIHIPRRQAIPMTVEGVSYGLMWGDIHADAELVNDELHINLRAPTLRVDLPPQRNAALESLEDNPAVSVLQPLGPTPPPTAVGGGPSERVLPSRVVIRLELGDNVGISREDMKIELNTPPPPGNPTITIDGAIELHGSVRILGGRVPVAGRVFRIEHGVVRFTGTDPTDPALDIDAVYEGADTSGTRIDVHVGGTAHDIKLSLRSSPAKPESELLGILAFGEAAPGAGLGASQTGAAGSVGGAAAAGAAAVGAGSAILTTGINQILSQSIFPIRTRVLTGSSTLASASLELTERVRFEYIRQFGTVRYGQPQDVNQFALDWRFKPRWLVRAVVGDRGTTTLDVLWNRWY